MVIIAGILGLVFGGQWVVDGAVAIAKMLEVSEKSIDLTVVAAGTSLPELVTSAMAAYRRKPTLLWVMR
jgi:Ca2+/Na+ antiporter